MRTGTQALTHPSTHARARQEIADSLAPTYPTDLGPAKELVSAHPAPKIELSAECLPRQGLPGQHTFCEHLRQHLGT
eukprot:5280815-Alexandrium_andersonii.AAC.1